MSLNMDNSTAWQVLLVDDERDNLEVVADSLQFFGMTVKTALNGQVCLTLLKDWLPDLILLDLSMPVMDGWATLRHLKSADSTKSIPVVALSAHAIIGDSQRALDAGFDGYMTKPVNVPTLVQDLRAALKDFAARQAATPSQPAVPPSPAEPVTVHTPEASAPGQPPVETVSLPASDVREEATL